MIARDLRTFLRQPGQLAALLLSLAVVCLLPVVLLASAPDGGVGAGFPVEVAEDEGERREGTGTDPRAESGAPVGESAWIASLQEEVRRGDPSAGSIARWGIVCAVGVVSILLCFTFGTTIALGAFVGEREGRTAELLLAAPFSRRRLYLARISSPLVTSVAMAYVALAALACLSLLAAAWWGPELAAGSSRVAAAELSEGLRREAVLGLLAALPVPVAAGAMVTGLCTIASVRSETSKGAAQLFTMGIMVVSFGLVLGPILLPNAALHQLAHRWVALGFGAQYGILLGSAAGLALGLLLTGYLLFDRERMLT